MSAPSDVDVANPVLTTTDEASALFSTTNGLLALLTTRLKERPHGQISLIQLPDVFLIKARLEQLVELETKKVKHQETLVQMAMDREEEGAKGTKKRAKNTGTQAMAMRQAVAEEVGDKTADLQRYIARLEDRLRRTEKLLEPLSNDNKCLKDEVNFLASDLNKLVKAPKAASQQVTVSLLNPLETKIKEVENRVTTAEDRVNTADIKTRAVVKCIQEEHETVLKLCKNDKINDSRHEGLQTKLDELSESQKTNDERHGRAVRHRRVHAEKLDEQEKAADVLRERLNGTGEKLESAIRTVDSNAWLLDSIIQGHMKHIRFLQSRVRVDLMEVWDRSAHRLQREFILSFRPYHHPAKSVQAYQRMKRMPVWTEILWPGTICPSQHVWHDIKIMADGDIVADVVW